MEGLVVKEQSGFFWVEGQDGQIYMCRLRGRLLEEAQASDIAAIGDRVTISAFEDKTGQIEAVAERTSVVSRAQRTVGFRGAGAAEREQVIIANADQAIFVFAAAAPAPSFRLLDRFLVMGEKSELGRLIVIVNKIDLADRATIEAQFAPYTKMGYMVVYTSAVLGLGLDDLRALLQDRVSVFTGPSGVGKSSLLNTLQPGLGRAIRQISEANQEGTHTTRDSELIKLDVGGYLADTPGIRTLTVWDVEPEELDGYYRDIAAYVAHCRFRDCTHRSEPKCAVLAAVASGAISRQRYTSYLSLREELEAAYALD